VTDHIDEASLFWQEFKSRMGVSVNPTMPFDFQKLFNLTDLDLIRPFTTKEMDELPKSSLLTRHLG
jgi:hypothetical protein